MLVTDRQTDKYHNHFKPPSHDVGGA